MLKQTMKVLGMAALGIMMAGCGMSPSGLSTTERDPGLRAAAAVSGTKRALMVGINAYQYVNPLRGCINDLNDVKAQVLSKQGYQASDIVTLTDGQATRANILKNLQQLVAASKPGDYLYFHYSGHGAQIDDTNGDEPDGQDEILCPVDLRFSGGTITGAVVDDEIQSILGGLKPGVGFLFVSDSCHSGSIDDARRGVRGLNLPRGLRSTDTLVYNRANQNTFKARVAEKKYTLLSGCQDDQTSADAYINNRYCGALTHYFLEAVNAGGLKQTYSQLHKATLAGLEKNGYDQRPALVGASNISLFTIAD